MSQILNELKNRPLQPNQIEWLDTVVAKQLKKNPSLSLGEIEHVLDWINSKQGPKTCRGLSWKHAIEKTEKWVAKLNKKAGKIIETDEDTEVVFKPKSTPELVWVKLVTEAAYKREGHLMGHCIGGYWGKSDSVNYSLRDLNNKPHATLEVVESNKQIQQISGKGNGPIHPKYIKAVMEFHKFLGMPIRDSHLPNLGYHQLSDSLLSVCNDIYKKLPFIMMNNKKYVYIWGVK
jgi:hypothetical protein